MSSKKKGGRVVIAEMFAALDAIASQVSAENAETDTPYSAKFGGEVHQRFVEWRRENPDTSGELQRTYRDLKRWDDSKHPRIAKAKGQGLLGFYDDNAHLAIDEQGGRVLFKDATLKHWDAWWDVQEEEEESRKQAHRSKTAIYYEMRPHLKETKATAGQVMREVFNWPDALIEESANERAEAAD